VTATSIDDPQLGTAGWLTGVLRPAGTLGPREVDRLAEALAFLAASSDMVVVDLGAARVPDPARLAAALRAPARRLTGAGRCLLLVGAAPSLVAALDRARVEVATSPAA
jgi:hypothetical protein